ncbi:MAG: hypothetical protein GTO24_17315 [candidate division Zixibacteria bacterium]|nr:hypothetical protein [candidate division Zixibacteria bacterium]
MAPDLRYRAIIRNISLVVSRGFPTDPSDGDSFGWPGGKNLTEEKSGANWAQIHIDSIDKKVAAGILRRH